MFDPHAPPPDAPQPTARIRWLLVILAVSLALRLAAGWVWQSRLGPRQFEFGDSETYWSLARSIAHGEPYEYEENPAFRTPGYPLLLAPLFLFRSADPPVMWARGLSAVYGTLAVLATWWLARRLVSPRAALLAASIAAFYPGQVVLGALVLSEAPFCAAMVAGLAAWVAACQAQTVRRSSGWAWIAGVLTGVASLIRPSWLLFAPLACGCFLIAAADRRRIAREVVFVFLGLATAVAPWWVRNYRVIGHFVPTTLQVGASLYDGLNPDATGGSNMQFAGKFGKIGEYRGCSKAEAAYRLDRQMRAEAIRWAVSHPDRAIWLAGVKLVRLWNVWPNEVRYSSWGVRLLIIFTYIPTLFLGIIGVYWTLCKGPVYWLCWLPAVYLTALHLVFVSSMRYREPAMLSWMVLAVMVVGEKWQRGRGTKSITPTCRL